jgi:hypothetical protein
MATSSRRFLRCKKIVPPRGAAAVARIDTLDDQSGSTDAWKYNGRAVHGPTRLENGPSGHEDLGWKRMGKEHSYD